MVTHSVRGRSQQCCYDFSAAKVETGRRIHVLYIDASPIHHLHPHSQAVRELEGAVCVDLDGNGTPFWCVRGL